MTPAGTQDADLAKKLSNPVASLISVPFQWNYDHGFGPSDGDKVTLNSETTYDWTSNEWSVPINAMVAKLVTIDKQPISLQAGVRYYAASSDNGPDGFGARAAVTFLFPKQEPFVPSANFKKDL